MVLHKVTKHISRNEYVPFVLHGMSVFETGCKYTYWVYLNPFQCIPIPLPQVATRTRLPVNSSVRRVATISPAAVTRDSASMTMATVARVINFGLDHVNKA